MKHNSDYKEQILFDNHTYPSRKRVIKQCCASGHCRQSLIMRNVCFMMNTDKHPWLWCHDLLQTTHTFDRLHCYWSQKAILDSFHLRNPRVGVNRQALGWRKIFFLVLSGLVPHIKSSLTLTVWHFSSQFFFFFCGDSWKSDFLCWSTCRPCGMTHLMQTNLSSCLQ